MGCKIGERASNCRTSYCTKMKLSLIETPEFIHFNEHTWVASMTETRIDTGSHDLDSLIHDGITRSGITSIYGEAGTGKTTIALQITRQTAMQGLKVLYVDSDRSFTQQRFQQITGVNFHDLSELVLLFFPEDFEEQR